MKFEDKVRSMTAKEIILAMVTSLIHPPTINVDMTSFGYVKKTGWWIFKKEVCFGCAATNTICEIAGKKFTPSSILDINTRSEFVNSDYAFMRYFEMAIDSLRRGNVGHYNSVAHIQHFAKITEISGQYLPHLSTDYTNEDLTPYIRLANLQP